MQPEHDEVIRRLRAGETAIFQIRVMTLNHQDKPADKKLWFDKVRELFLVCDGRELDEQLVRVFYADLVVRWQNDGVKC